MAESVRIEALGVPIVIDLDGLDSDAAEAVREAWQDAAASPGSDSGESESHVVRAREIGDGGDLPRLLQSLSQRVTVTAITARQGELWMLHAAGLALPDGRVIVLVGPSGRGKTTASRALGQTLGYLSDETVGIAPDGTVVAHRKPLSIIEQAGAPKAERAPSSLGLARVPEVPLRLAAIVLLDRDAEGPEEPTVEHVDLGDALDDLVSETSFLPTMSDALQQIAGLLAPLGGVRRVRYREATTLIGAIEQIVAPAQAPEWWDAEPPVAVTGAGFRRGDVADAIALRDPDRIALLQVGADGNGTVRLLAGIAPALWRAASGVSFDELVAAAVAAHGSPDDADPAVLVRAVVGELVDAGVLVEAEEPIWRIRDDVAWYDSGDRIVVLSLADAAGDADAQPQPQVLEGSAALIWLALADGGGTSEEIATLVADASDAPYRSVLSDIVTFIGALGDQRLVEASFQR